MSTTAIFPRKYGIYVDEVTKLHGCYVIKQVKNELLKDTVGSTLERNIKKIYFERESEREIERRDNFLKL